MIAVSGSVPADRARESVLAVCDVIHSCAVLSLPPSL
ncbi:hypothetical protein KIPB_017257, partial [Kipferlia bialata]|eukprot:g17257.t1